VARKYSKCKPLARLIADFHTYVEQNSGFIVDYAERQRYGERVSTGFVKSAVNQVLGETAADAVDQKRCAPRCSTKTGKIVFGNNTPAFGPCQQSPYRWLLSPTAPHFLMSCPKMS